MASLTLKSLLADIDLFVVSVPKLLRRTAVTADLAHDVEKAISISDQPFSLAIVGQMKAGKSSLINALLGQSLARIGVTETTATLNKFCFGSAEEAKYFRVIWDKVPERFAAVSSTTSANTSRPSALLDCAELPLWDGDSEVARHTHLLEFVSEAPFLKRTVIYDTPGSGTTITDHASKSSAILRSEEIKVDCILYIIGPIPHKSDEDGLREFESATRLIDSSPYNAVAVINGWEKIDKPEPWLIAPERAAKAFSQLRTHVADVIPVSGPWAFAAKKLRPPFWEDVRHLVASLTKSELELLIAMEPEFTSRPLPGQMSVGSRQQLLKESGLPWRSFATLLKFASVGKYSDAGALRDAVMEASGIERLMEFLDSRLLSRSHIIRASRVLADAMKPTERGIQLIRGRLTDLEHRKRDAMAALEELKAATGKVNRSREVLTQLVNDQQQETESLTSVLAELEVHRRSLLESQEMFDHDLVALTVMDHHRDSFGGDEAAEIRRILGVYGYEPADRLRRPDAGEHDLTETARARMAYWKRESHGAGKSERGEVLRHIVKRLEGMIDAAHTESATKSR